MEFVLPFTVEEELSLVTRKEFVDDFEREIIPKIAGKRVRDDVSSWRGMRMARSFRKLSMLKRHLRGLDS